MDNVSLCLLWRTVAQGGIFYRKNNGKNPKKRRLRTDFYSLYIIITQTDAKVKRKIQKNPNKTKNSIFIDEKIYSVDRLKKILRSKRKENGFTCF